MTKMVAGTKIGSHDRGHGSEIYTVVTSLDVLGKGGLDLVAQMCRTAVFEV